MNAEKLIFEQQEALCLLKTSFVDNLRKTPHARRSVAYYDGRLKLLERNFEKMNLRHEKLVDLSFEDENLRENDYFVKGVFSEIEECYLDIKDEVIQKLKPAENQNDEFNKKENVKHDHGSSLKLPRIEIPKFGGNYKEWISFRDLFVSTVHDNQKLSKSEKLLMLKNHLVGEASQLLKHVPITETSYDQAWSSLTQRYENTRSIVTSYLHELFSQTHLTSESAISLRKLLDTTTEMLHALKNLSVSTDSWDPFIVYFVVQRLDAESRRLWEQSLGSQTQLPTFQELEDFLNARHRALESCTGNIIGTKSKSLNIITKPKTPSSVRTFHMSKDPPCPACQGSHFLYKCEGFRKLPIDQRRELARSKTLCLNCLVPGHFSNKCHQRSRCHVCNKKHHTLLHFNLNSQSSNTNELTHVSAIPSPHSESTLSLDSPQVMNASTSVAQPSNIQVNTNFGSIHQQHRVMLATAVVRAQSQSGTYLLRALLDQGSEGSLITESAAQLLRLPQTSTEVTIKGIGSMTTNCSRKEVCLKISPHMSSSPTFQVTTLVMPSLTGFIPSFEISPVIKTYFADLQLADPSCFDSGRIDLLLGADIYSQILLPEIKRLAPELPLAQRTVFGWILSGPCASATKARERKICHLYTSQCDHSSIEKQLKQFWELENVIEKPVYTPEEEACEKLFKSTYSRTDQGRYIVHLPFKSTLQGSLSPSFDGTRENAIRRFNYLEKRFRQSANLRTEYSKFMEEYLELGHMTPAAFRETSNEYYLPHHPVFKESSSTTKLRVVFDGSSKDKGGKSLNETLSIGPTLQSELADIILRWRQHKVVMAADIEKMYRQIVVADEDTTYQKIVWRFNDNEPIQDFRLLTVTYGTSCAPYLALRTLKQLSIDYMSSHPEASQIIQNNFYVDDVMFGSHSEENVLKLQSQLLSLLAMGGLHLRKWSSNRSLLLANIPEEDREIKSVLPIGEEHNSSVKTLGVQWFPSTDEFGYCINLPATKGEPTKRSLLSDIARLFDPLGWLSPSVVIAKMMLQQLWLSGVGWDEPLPAELHRQRILLRNDLKTLGNVRIPRWFRWSSPQSQVELHGFADASMKAYAATVYIRIMNEDNKIQTTLVAAKTRVSPTQQVSLPRLELCAAVLVTRLLDQVQRALEIPVNSVHAWSDSTIVLCWLRGHPSRWKPFVANRVSEIQMRLTSNQWHYVSTRDNPADCSSRGMSPTQLIDHGLWWNGPCWLSEDTRSWTPTSLPSDLDTDLEVRKVRPLISAITVNEFDLLSRYSSLSTLLNVTAYIIRFIRNCRPRAQRVISRRLHVDEVNFALQTLCRLSQATDFADELSRLQRSTPVSKKSRIASLDPFVDDVGLIRVGGRLQLSSLPIEMKHPILLSHKSPITKLLIREAHIVTLHGGITLMLAYLRRKYWIVHAKNLVKQELHRCPTCIRYRSETRTQMMGHLPNDRVKLCRPFLHSGVDYAGPVTVKAAKNRGTLTTKAYICLFICLATKAIHLELVSDYTSDAFIAAFRRFTARRGKCTSLYSDCGTTFIGANKKLQQLYRKGIEELPYNIATMLAQDQTTWHFIPPASPHFGGLWEAGVKSTKHHLRRIIGEASLTFEEFSTLLSQIEAVLNSRPLCPMSNEPNDITTLTPGHFLVGEPLISIPEPNLCDVNVNRLTRWQLVQRLHQHFWQRWSNEYVTRLQQRPKWLSRTENLKQGQLVIIKEDRLPPANWQLGRIISTHPGHDGLVRVATVKCKNGVIKRPVTKLCLLPASDPDDKESRSLLSRE